MEVIRCAVLIVNDSDEDDGSTALIAESKKQKTKMRSLEKHDTH